MQNWFEGKRREVADQDTPPRQRTSVPHQHDSQQITGHSHKQPQRGSRIANLHEQYCPNHTVLRCASIHEAVNQFTGSVQLALRES